MGEEKELIALLNLGAFEMDRFEILPNISEMFTDF